MFLDLQDVAEAVALSTRGVQRLIQEGNFPKPRAVSVRRVAWLTREVEEWCEARPVSTCLPPPKAGGRKDS